MDAPDAIPQAEVDAPLPNRRERRRLEVFQRILDAGDALFEQKGFDETRVAEICERADVAYGTFFNHFPSKRDLLVAMGDRAVAEIAADLDALAAQPLTIEAALIELFEGAARFLQTASSGRRALAARIQAVAFSDAPGVRDRSFHTAFESFLRRAALEGRVRSDVPPETLADLVSSTYTSLTLRWVQNEDFPVGSRAAGMARLLASTLAPRDRASISRKESP
jgi:AcrR family transcriptional regulator